MVTCTRCVTGRPCLSHTVLPFNGTMIVSPLDPMLKKHKNRIETENKQPGETTVLFFQNTSQTRYRPGKHLLVFGPEGDRTHYLVNLKALTFDEIAQFEHGLSYLDWLSGQPWLYGQFEKRLSAYLRNPCIQRELEHEFPDPDDDSWDPPFFSQELQPNQIASMPLGNRSRWHGEHVPYPEPDTWQSEMMTTTKAWRLAADLLNKFETATDPNDLLDLDFEEIKQVCRKIDKPAEDKIRAAYKTFRERLRNSYADPVGNAYRFHFTAHVTKDGRLSKRAKKECFLSDIVRPIMPLAHTRA